MFTRTTNRCSLALSANIRSKTFLAGAIFASIVFALPAGAQLTLHESDKFSISGTLGANAIANQQSNPWFGEDVANLGVEVDNWLEFSIEPELNVTVQDVFGGELYGSVSVVGTQSYGESADGIVAGLDDPSAGTLEKLNVGWKRDLGDDNFFEIVGGNFDYEIGSGFLVKDGGADGGDRGGFYLGARSAFRGSGLVRLQQDGWLLEGFWLGNNPRRDGIKGNLAGANVEFEFARGSVGATFIQLAEVDDPVLAPLAEDLKTYDVRADYAVTDDLTVSGEYAFQDGGDTFEGTGWYAQVDYDADFLPLSPTITYRYAALSGDDPATPEDEGFEPLAYGFSDYETWYQGEIAGNWIFANTNLKTHLVKASAPVSDSVSVTGAFLNISIEEPAGLGINDDDFGSEIDFFVDWEVNDNWFLSASAAVLFPGDAAEQFTGGDETWSHFMLYASYSY